ncbi:MAG: hypothetical protein A3J58_01590 [Candidatus Sungbacteria bacterium RIFCSPHIGHO2_02_FULL_52_23]|uniref:HicB-like antitoxin of toxin-antitoxin system domain-containing protein n=1 Tax=Candidatus Sungbacteria bacterium RIFCSPHIGHO2_02_FULL_52_23 TaxID=1802274 RepID=A0A1G2KVC1_9BACT|nr:MAG: hypothetical protein A3J58_01590 [Candidatus Sungbacteria bacterium RIFCSPHIGHO2_02_FULL_52_23]
MKPLPQKRGPHLNLPVVFSPEPEGGFTVTVPSLPGCVTFGKNLNEAKQMAQEAIELYLEDLAADGESLPANTDAFLSTVAVTLPRPALMHA